MKSTPLVYEEYLSSTDAAEIPLPSGAGANGSKSLKTVFESLQLNYNRLKLLIRF